MTRVFVELPIFCSKWKELKLSDGDLFRLQDIILSNAKIGPVIKETGGVRKMRFAFENKGKSGSVRVIYIDFEEFEKVYLITAYQKNEKANLSKAEKNELKKLIALLEKQLKEKKGETK